MYRVTTCTIKNCHIVETVFKSELFLYNGVDIGWQFESNVTTNIGEFTTSNITSGY